MGQVEIIEEIIDNGLHVFFHNYLEYYDANRFIDYINMFINDLYLTDTGELHIYVTRSPKYDFMVAIDTKDQTSLFENIWQYNTDQFYITIKWLYASPSVKLDNSYLKQVAAPWYDDIYATDMPKFLYKRQMFRHIYTQIFKDDYYSIFKRYFSHVYLTRDNNTMSIEGFIIK